MSAEATRMQNLASEFSKIFRGDTPGPPQREGTNPCRTHPSPASVTLVYCTQMAKDITKLFFSTR